MTSCKGSLILVGSGIKFYSHLTIEVKAHIEKADRVIYLVNDPITKGWIKSSNQNSISLDELYNRYFYRSESYEKITNFILEALRSTNSNICVVLYGHPTVFAKPGLNAARQAQKEGFFVKILPGISAEACLFADLLIDPGSDGSQSFEATDFLIYQKKIDPTCHVFFWQVDVIGARNNPKNYDNSIGLGLLFDELDKFYPADHPIVKYEASQYPGIEPQIFHSVLNEIITIKFSPISILYIPPYKKPKIRNENVSKLKLDKLS